MKRFLSYDGTELAYRTMGAGEPLVCVPGGPGQAVEYLGDLGGLSAHRTLILLDNRGTGASAAPTDPKTYRVDRLVGDIESLRAELGLHRMDLFGHSAAGGLCMLYAAAHEHRLHRLVLANPSMRVVGLASDAGADAVMAQRAHEPWYEEATLAYHASKGSESYEQAEKYWLASAPLSYGRWNQGVRAHAAAAPAQFCAAATEGFYADFEPNTVALHARLATLGTPVLVIAGERDLWPTSMAAGELVTLFRSARLAVQPRAGHFPWVDDPEMFVGIVESFLADE